MKLTGKSLKKEIDLTPSVTRHVNSDGDLEFVDIFLSGPTGYIRGVMTLSEARRLANDLTNALKPVRALGHEDVKATCKRLGYVKAANALDNALDKAQRAWDELADRDWEG